MVLLCSMCFKSNNQISQTLSITQLTKHHCKQLIPTSEMLYIAISVILANIVVKLSSVQKSGELGKNVFVLEHNWYHSFQALVSLLPGSGITCFWFWYHSFQALVSLISGYGISTSSTLSVLFTTLNLIFIPSNVIPYVLLGLSWYCGRGSSSRILLRTSIFCSERFSCSFM